MKIAEIDGGVVTTLRVRGVSGTFLRAPQVEAEVELVQSGDQILLRVEDLVDSVVGVTPADNTELEAVVTSGLPVVAYVA